MNSQRLQLSPIIIIIWAMLLLSSYSSFAQPCPDDNQFWFDGQVPPCDSFGSVNIGGGTYATFDVTSGLVYTFSTCNSSFNTQLSGYDLGGNNLFFNDDNGPDCTSDRASVEWLATFTGQIKVLIDSFNCTSFTTTSAVLQYRQTLTITSSSTAMCAGESRALTANTAGGTFTGTGVANDTFTAPGTNGIYTITYTLGNCSATQSIQVNENPSVSISSPSGLSYCSGDSISLSAIAAAGSGSITSYQWKRNGVNIGADADNLTVTQDGSYTVDVFNSNGCNAASTPIVITELQTPTVDLTGLDSAYCLYDAQAVLTGSPSGGTFSGPGITGASFNPSLAGVNTHSVTYSYTAPNGCSNTDTETTTVNDQPPVTFNLNPNSFCTNDAAVQLAATPAGGVFSGASVQGDIFDPSAAGAGSHWLVYTYTTIEGCVSSDSVLSVVKQSPTVTFTGLNPDYCITDASASLSGSPMGGTFSGTGVSGSTFVPFSAGAGSHDISYQYTAPNGCPDTETQTVIVNDKPVISFTIDSNGYCLNAGPITLNATPAGGTYYGQGISGNTFDPSVAGVGGPYNISYTFTDTIGCRSTSTATQAITVNALPTVTISGIGAEYCLNASPVALSGNPANGTFSGNGVSGNTFDPSAAGTGTQQITYDYTDNNGCSNSNVAITTVQPLPVVTLTGLDAVYCEDDGVVLMTGSPTGGSYSGPGVIANSFNPSLAGDGGPYDITYTYTDVNGCVGNAVSNVSVNAIPSVAIIGLDETYCAYEGAVALTLVPAGGQLSGSGVSGNAFTPSLAGAGNHLIVYVYSDNAGCVNSITENVAVDECVGIASVKVPGLNVYPNPARDFVNVEFSGIKSAGVVLSVYNSHGQKMLETTLRIEQKQSSVIDLSAFSKGVYLFHLVTANETILKKVAVN